MGAKKKTVASAQHTPGPWAEQGHYGNLMTEIGNGSRAVATVWTHDDENQVVENRRVRIQKEDAEGMANARLIASAPELVEALRGLLDYCSEAVLPADEPARNAARAALKKAGVA